MTVTCHDLAGRQLGAECPTCHHAVGMHRVTDGGGGVCEVCTAIDTANEVRRRARERVLKAEGRALAAERERDTHHAWALEAFTEQRRLAERCTFLYGAAMALGASHEDLR